MKIYYIEEKIVKIELDKDGFMTPRNENALNMLEIDELSSQNKNICIDLINSFGKIDINELNKYYILDGQLYLRDGWTERIETILT